MFLYFAHYILEPYPDPLLIYTPRTVEKEPEIGPEPFIAFGSQPPHQSSSIPIESSTIASVTITQKLEPELLSTKESPEEDIAEGSKATSVVASQEIDFSSITSLEENELDFFDDDDDEDEDEDEDDDDDEYDEEYDFNREDSKYKSF